MVRSLLCAVLLVLALVVPAEAKKPPRAAALAAEPALTVTADLPTLTVEGSGFAPQTVFLWVRHSECGVGNVCGLYATPTVADDGTFRETYTVPGDSGEVTSIVQNQTDHRWYPIATAGY